MINCASAPTAEDPSLGSNHQRPFFSFFDYTILSISCPNQYLHPIAVGRNSPGNRVYRRVKNEFNSIFFLRDSSYGGCVHCLLLCRFHAHVIGPTNLNFDPSYDVVYNSAWQLPSHETNRFSFPKSQNVRNGPKFPVSYPFVLEI